MKKIKSTARFITSLIITILLLSTESIHLTVKSITYEDYFSEDDIHEPYVTENGFHCEKTNWSSIIIMSYDGTEPDVVLPNRIEDRYVEDLPDRLFADNQTIKSVDLSQLHSSITNFGSGLFENSSVESVILPKAIKYIPNDTFKNCKNLKSVEFGNNIEIIAKSAFEGTDYILPDDLSDKVKDVDCIDTFRCYLQSNGFQYYIYDNRYNTFYDNIPSGVHISIEGYVGADTDIVIPESIDNIPVKTINSYVFTAFLRKKNVVTSLVYPQNINYFSIELGYPEKLKSLTFNSDELILYDRTNMSKLGIEEITFPLLNYDGKGILNSGIFKDSKTIRNVRFEKGKGDLKLESNAFTNCSALDTVTFNGYSSVSFDHHVFNNSSLRRLEVNADCNIKSTTFKGCNNLQEIVFNGNISSQKNAFIDCPLKNIIFEDTSVSISPCVFDMCSPLTNINSEPAFDSSTGDFNEKYKDFIIRNFSSSDDVGFVNDYVMWHVKDIVSKYTNDSMSDMEKAKALHDWVCENISYSTKAYAGDEDHNDLSPFLTGVTVCDGYARAYNLLLHEAGIETLLVNSPDHIWNVIKIGGHYFHVDTTWDDSDKYNHNWFLKSDNEVKAETSSHSQWVLKTASSLHDFQSDVLPECSYSMGDCNMDGSVSVADTVKMNRYIMGADAVNSDDLVLYDLDFSGSVDVFDMITMRKKITENSALVDIYAVKEWLLGKTDQISPELDMNGDSMIDVFDMIILRQNLSK